MVAKQCMAAAAVALAAQVCRGGAGAAGNFFEGFDGADAELQWAESQNARYQGGEWKWGSDGAALAGDVGVEIAVPRKFYGLSRKLDEPVEVGGGKDFVIQYEVRFSEAISCSGSYLKLLLDEDGSFDPAALEEATPYSIMFGPDNCGATNKVHVIFRQQNPVTKDWEEKHMTKAVAARKDKVSHLYTLVVRPDNSFSVLIDGKEEASGSLANDDDFKPPFAQPKEIDDPNDKKPADWVDNAKMADPEATKPDDWDEDAPKRIADPAASKPAGWLDDEPLELPDPEASKPEDWDEEDDGEWEAPIVPNPKCKSAPGCGEWKAPMIDNPDYKGKWTAPLIDNPDYKGVWKPRRIANPAYFDEPNPVSTIRPVGAIAIEILANDAGIRFDSIMIGNDVAEATEYASTVFAEKQAAEMASDKSAGKEATRAMRQKAYEEGTLEGYIMYYFGDAADAFSEAYEANPAIVLGAGGTLILVIVASLFRAGPSASSDDDDYNEQLEELQRQAALHKKDDDEAAEDDDEADGEDEGAADAEDDDDEDDSGDDEDDEDEKPSARRRIGRA